jgi:hypothetical protein
MAKQAKTKTATTRNAKKGVRTTTAKTAPKASAKPAAKSTPRSNSQSATAVAEPKPKSKSKSRSGPSVEQIQARAYEIYLARGGRPGSPEADWLQAERELREGK